MTKARLEEAGFDVLSAARGESGLDVARREKPDAYLTKPYCSDELVQKLQRMLDE